MEKERDEQTDKTVDALTRLCLLHEESLKLTVPVNVLNVVELRLRLTELDEKLEEKELQL